jgi:uncharacterized SAM-binding protein YcdF (DUF218 family)
MFEPFSIKSYVELLVLPPANLFLLYLAGIWMARRRPRLGSTVQYVAVFLLYAFSTPVGSEWLLRTLESAEPVDTASITASGASAMVVLGGDMESTPEYGGGTMGPYSLQRLRYAARLARATQLPVLVTGGVLRRGERPIAAVMRDALAEEYGVAARWIEDRSRTTAENARFSAAILNRDGVGSIVLVTNSFHMKRATFAFMEAGLKVLPAPTMLADYSEFDAGALIPRGEALLDSFLAAHEWVGLVWYRLGSVVPGLL